MKSLLTVFIAIILFASCSDRTIRVKAKVIATQGTTQFWPEDDGQLVFRDADTLVSVGDTLIFTDEYPQFKAVVISKDQK